MKIAIFRALNLGDILCSVPAIRAIRQAYPGAEITFIGLPGSVSIINRFPNYIDRFVAFPGYPGLPEQEFNSDNYELFLSSMREYQFDLLLQMQGNGSVVNEMLTSFDASRLVGFCENESLQNENFLAYPNRGHELDRHLALLQHLGIPSRGTEMEFPLNISDAEELDGLGLPIKPGNYVCVHPGSRGKYRQWPPVYFASLADYCAKQGHRIVLTGTADEIELGKKVAALMETEPIQLAGKTSLGALGFLLQQSFALIANCTGVSHMAAALRIPSLIISMDGEAGRWAPLNQALHRTINWALRPDYGMVLKALEDLYQANNLSTAARTAGGPGRGTSL